MTPDEFKASRLALGYETEQSISDEWGLGKYGERTIRRYELPKGHKDHRPVPALAVYCLKLMAEKQAREGRI